MKSLTFKETSKLLNLLYVKYNKNLSSDDPIWLVHRFDNENDKEIIAFIISCYCYGNIKQIRSFINKFIVISNQKPFYFIQTFDENSLKKHDMYYRFNTHLDFVELLNIIQGVVKDYGSLKNLFHLNYDEKDENIIKGLGNFVKSLKQYRKSKSNTFNYLLPDISRNSACKRILLFMRWMVRKDEIDTGLWSDIVSPSKLIIPVDTHIYKNSSILKLTNRKTCDLKFAIEVTNKLKEFDPLDPLKYDFALCHIGVEGKEILKYQ